MSTRQIARRAVTLIALLLLAVAVAGCSGDGAGKTTGAESAGDGDGGGTATSTTATATNPDEPVSSDDDADGGGSGGGSSGGGGSGDDDAPGTPGAGDPSAGGTPANAKLTIVVKEGEPPRTRTVRVACPDPTGANAGACITLAASPDVFDPLPKDAVCTEQYGGPETAHVTGTFDGDDVDVEFSRTDGCQIARWEKAQPIWRVVRG